MPTEKNSKNKSEWLRSSGAFPGRSELGWAMPEMTLIPEIKHKTGESIRIILDVDKNRINALNETGRLVEEAAKDLSVIKDLSSRQENSAVEKAENLMKEFKRIPLIENFLTPPIYARVEFVLKEFIKKMKEMTLILQKRKQTDSDLKKLKSLSEFQIIVSDVSATINSFANQLKTFGAPMIELKSLLDDALKIPGYPLETIRAVHTKKDNSKELKYYYEFYRDSVYDPSEIERRKENVLKIKEETLAKLTADRRDNVENILKHIKAKQKFAYMIKKILTESAKLKFEHDEDIDFNSNYLIEQMMLNKVFENPDILGFLVEEDVLENQSVIDSLGELVKLQEKIIFWQNKSADEMLKDKLRNENFAKLNTEQISLEGIRELYNMWKEVEKRVKQR